MLFILSIIVLNIVYKDFYVNYKDEYT